MKRLLLLALCALAWCFSGSIDFPEPPRPQPPKPRGERLHDEARATADWTRETQHDVETLQGRGDACARALIDDGLSPTVLTALGALPESDQRVLRSVLLLPDGLRELRLEAADHTGESLPISTILAAPLPFRCSVVEYMDTTHALQAAEQRLVKLQANREALCRRRDAQCVEQSIPSMR